MKNASKMARYMMMRGNRDGGNYERENEVRNGYGGYGNEGGNYARDNYGVDNRFRDRRGREHYDNGRFAPRNDMGGMDGGDYRADSRSNSPGRDYSRENRESDERMVKGEYRTDNNYARMNTIGFDRPQEVDNHYPFRIDYEPRNEMEHRRSERMAGGAISTEMEFTPELAKEWTKTMHNEDGTKGEHWNMDQVKKLMMQRGVQYNTAEVYAIMNALYSDYCKVFKKYGFNSPEAYLDLALAWLNDTDSVPNKAMMYYECIVKH